MVAEGKRKSFGCEEGCMDMQQKPTKTMVFWTSIFFLKIPEEIENASKEARMSCCTLFIQCVYGFWYRCIWMRAGDF